LLAGTQFTGFTGTKKVRILTELCVLAVLLYSLYWYKKVHIPTELCVLAVLLLGAEKPVAQRGKQETHRVGPRTAPHCRSAPQVLSLLALLVQCNRAATCVSLPRTAPHCRSAPQVLSLLALLVQTYKYFTGAQDAMRLFCRAPLCCSSDRAATELQQSCSMRFFAAHRASLSKRAFSQVL
jgi:hypothetical protein